MNTSVSTLPELGVIVPRRNVVGALSPLYIPPSNFYVKPYVAWIPSAPVWSPDPREVTKVMGCKMSYISNRDNWTDYEVRGKKVPGFLIDKKIVWGATAMILSELIGCWE